jgi:hypothetical protein
MHLEHRARYALIRICCMTLTKKPYRKVIITGTGRAGTTFLVRLLTELGLDTGFTRDTWRTDYHEHSSSGLELRMADPKAPYIVKNPALCTELEPLLATGLFHIDHAFVPMRQLNDAACSRARIGGAGGNVPGGLWQTEDPNRQKGDLAEMFHDLVYTLVVHEIPHTFLHFPRFARDPYYTYRKLAPVLQDIEWPLFKAAFNRIADPTLIHDFSKVTPASVISDIGQKYLADKQHLRWQRRFRRALSVSAIAVVLLLFVFFYKGSSQMPIIGSSVSATPMLPQSGR